jgi:hypothetical protein
LRVKACLQASDHAGSIRRFAHNGIIHVAPNPFLSRLNRTHHRVMYMLKVFGGMLILRRIAATHMSAGHAHPQVNPVIANLYAVFADIHLSGCNFDLIQMLTLPGHDSLLMPSDPGKLYFALNVSF